MALRSAFQRSAALCPAEASTHAAGPRRVAVSGPVAARSLSRRRQFGEVSFPAASRRRDVRLSAIISAPGGGLEGALGPEGKRPTENQLRANLDAIVAPVQQDMDVMETNVKALVGERHPMLLAAAEQIFGAGGKKLRPVLCFLVARATAVAMGLPCVPHKRGTSRGALRVTLRCGCSSGEGRTHVLLPVAVFGLSAPGQSWQRKACRRLLLAHLLAVPPRRDITWQHRRLSEITEMIHTASLVHDDVLDECSLRRGALLPSSVFRCGSFRANMLPELAIAPSSRPFRHRSRA